MIKLENVSPERLTRTNGDDLLIVDGNHRHQFAETNGLILPNVTILEKEADLREAIHTFNCTYKKDISFQQLARILSNRK